MNTYWGVEVWLHSLFAAALDEGKWLASRPDHHYPLDMRMGGPQSGSGRDGEEKNSTGPAGN